MKKKRTILDEIYDELKRKRVVLTLPEYARNIKTSKATIIRLRESPDRIDPNLISRAKEFLRKSIEESNDSKKVASEGDTEQLLRDLVGSLKGQLKLAHEKIERLEKELSLKKAAPPGRTGTRG